MKQLSLAAKVTWTAFMYLRLWLSHTACLLSIISPMFILLQEGVEAAEKMKSLEELTRQQAAEIKMLGDNYNSERVLRKKYYNMVEDMKGKIRVYCRARPLSKSEIARVSSVLSSPR